MVGLYMPNHCMGTDRYNSSRIAASRATYASEKTLFLQVMSIFLLALVHSEAKRAIT